MEWDCIESNWTQFKGSAKQQWGKITDDHLDMVAGERDALLGKIQKYYGITREQAEGQLSDWQGRQNEGQFAG